MEAMAFHTAMMGFPFTVLEPPELISLLSSLATRLAAAASAS